MTELAPTRRSGTKELWLDPPHFEVKSWRQGPLSQPHGGDSGSTSRHLPARYSDPILPQVHGWGITAYFSDPVHRPKTYWAHSDRSPNLIAVDHLGHTAISTHKSFGHDDISGRVYKEYQVVADSMASRSPILAESITNNIREFVERNLNFASVGHQVLQENLRYMLFSSSYVIVDGEWCTWREDETLGVVIKREPWSLLGTGPTVKDAIFDFRREAAEIATVMQHDGLDELTDEARRMRDFVLRYLPENG